MFPFSHSTGKLLLTSVAISMALSLSAEAEEVPVYKDRTRPLEERVEDALSRMTTQEKINIIHAQSKFSSPGVPRLGIPDLWCTDGPHGIRPEVKWDEWEQAGQTNDSCVAFPALTCVAASWNPEMSHLYGNALGEEARYRGKDVVLGPGVNIYRTPLNGRNFEYLGEDPYLAGEMVVPYIQGLQEKGVAACLKHFALNNNELNRHTTNVIIDDRTLYEIYLPAFKAGVQRGGTWSVMPAYNLYENQHLCHNAIMLNKILRDEWGFKGATISDWGGTHNTLEAITNGLDLEFGTWTDGLYAGQSNAYDNYYMAKPYFELIASGKVGTKELDEKVRHVLRLIFLTAMDYTNGDGEMCSDAHYEAARRIADDGIVLLQNTGNVLPIAHKEGGKILVVGENAIKMMTVGGGSSSLKVRQEILPIDGIRAAAGKYGMTVDYARGYVGDVTGEYNGVVTGQDLTDSRTSAELIAEAVKKAAEADYVIFIGGLNKSAGQDCEDADRSSLSLPYDQDAVISALADANPRLTVVNISGNAVAMPWVEKVPAIVQAWFLGSEAGHAIADVLFGEVNPSGHLPFTFPMSLSDSPAHALDAYPGIKRANEDVVDLEYKEGILVGYRWYDTKKIRPLFPFGHGLSYTTFSIGKPTASAKEITADEEITFTVAVTNTGNRAGAEVVQLYISDPRCSVLRPEKELKGFKKVWLEPGETKNVEITIGRDALSYFDPDAHEWVAEPGQFIATLAASSAPAKTSVKFELKK